RQHQLRSDVPVRDAVRRRQVEQDPATDGCAEAHLARLATVYDEAAAQSQRQRIARRDRPRQMLVEAAAVLAVIAELAHRPGVAALEPYLEPGLGEPLLRRRRSGRPDPCRQSDTGRQ